MLTSEFIFENLISYDGLKIISVICIFPYPLHICFFSPYMDLYMIV